LPTGDARRRIIVEPTWGDAAPLIELERRASTRSAQPASTPLLSVGFATKSSCCWNRSRGVTQTTGHSVLNRKHLGGVPVRPIDQVGLNALGARRPGAAIATAARFTHSTTITTD
jgi:hypothetical protein